MTDAREPHALRILRPAYGGYGVAPYPGGGGGEFLVPFSIPGELVEAIETGNSNELKLARIVEPSPARVEPGCPHFGACGGCHFQMASYDEQLRIKRAVLGDLLRKAGVSSPPEMAIHSAEPWGYRNRIRLRVERVEGEWRLGYNVRATTAFLPIVTCSIAAPVLWQTAEALLASAARHRDTAAWLDAASEVEFFCDNALARVQMTLFCAPRTRREDGSFARMMSAVQQLAPQLTGAGAVALDPRTGPTGRSFAAYGAAGLNYRVGDEAYWVTRGGFFQVNRFLIETLVSLVCEGRSGKLAWDLFAGVGLFSRVLARSFAQVAAVEASPIAAADLRTALSRPGPQHRAVQGTAIEFLREAAVQRERPELIVLDPPRAGAGAEVCALLAQLAPREIVYVSCDPATLARDLAALRNSQYRVAALHLVDLFPQTYHQEAVVILQRNS